MWVYFAVQEFNEELKEGMKEESKASKDEKSE